MIDLYTWPTPNGQKVHIMLEECGLPYTVHEINISKGDQFDPDFIKFSPNNKMPAIIDQDGPGGAPYPVFESGAILMYLAEKSGKFWPQDMATRYDVVQWLMFQMGGVGPMFGQAHHFRDYAPEKIPYAIDRYTNEAARLYRVLDKRLSESAYLACADYTIADMATFPWARNFQRKGQDPADYPHVARWVEVIDARPAVERGLAILADKRRKPGEKLDDETRKNMFGAAQYAKR